MDRNHSLCARRGIRGSLQRPGETCVGDETMVKAESCGFLNPCERIAFCCMQNAVAGIVYREVGGGMHEEAIKAQAVAVYTYIKFYGNDSHDLLCKPNPPQNVIDICRSVLGEALYYDGDFALTMFSASSGGYSANCYDVFSQDVPYLRSVYCEYDSVCDPHYATVTYMTADEVRSCIEADYGIKLSDNPENWFAPYVGDSGYLYNVIIDGQIDVRGNDLRACLGLKSPKFDIAYAQ